MEPIAIVGSAARLPGGAHDLESFAELLFDRVDAVREVPPERWSLAEFYDPNIAAPGKSRSRHAALLDRLDLFDAEFFGIAPREAARIDPAQRLILEVGWEAVENAGIDPHSLAGSMTGVYLGLSQSDYGSDLYSNADELDEYSASGTAYGTAVGRLSYFLDLVGPAVALDVACSGSLMSVHMAAQALRLRECDLALAGGANIILSPETGIIYSKARMLAPDGRCRTFSADAQGYVRGEGCGIVVLRRWADALERGDRILGVIRGSATNQDGRSVGLTAPRCSSQEALIAAALKAADVHPHAIDFVEAHGTGTPLGDPVEVAALGAVLCVGRPTDRPLVIGSVKTNIGHLESGAGIAGLLKLLIAFQREAIPPNLHFAEPNPLIEWDKLAITVPTETQTWPRGQRARIAGVSSFGFGGSNVHLIVEEPPVSAADDSTAAGHVQVLPISAKSPTALAELAKRYSTILDAAPLADICRTAATGRAHFAYRVAVTGTTAAEIAAGLSAAVAGLDAAAKHRSSLKIAFSVPAPSSQDDNAAATLIAACPAFAGHWQAALKEVGSAGAGALALALAGLWRSWGMVPRSVSAAGGGEAQAAPIVARLASEANETNDTADASTDFTVVLGGLEGPRAWFAVLEDLARAYVAGAAINWQAVHDAVPRRPVSLPTYPFERRRHWAPQVRAFARMPEASGTGTVQPQPPLIESLAKAPASRHLDLILRRLRDVFAPIQGLEGVLPTTTEFRAVGIDPMSADARERVELAFGSRLPPTLLLNNRNLGELARFLLAQVERADAATKAAPLAQAAKDDADLKARLSSKLAALR